MMNFDATYWKNQYKEQKTPWDCGKITTPLATYFDQLTDKDIRILIPGAGNAHEATYLLEKGFTNIFVLDIAEQPLLNFKKRNPTFPKEHCLQTDFFTFQGDFDLIIEHTFFCALPVEKRKDYVLKTHQLLHKKGKLVGLLFNREFEGNHPPFGGTKYEYEQLFSAHYHIKTMENCYNSIKPRQNNELFVIFEPKLLT